MPRLKNPKLLDWIEFGGAICGFHGVGWLAAGFLVQGMLMMIAGWALAILLGLTILTSWAIFDMFLPYPYSLVPAILPSVVWPAAAIWSGRRLRSRLEHPRAVQSA